MSYLSSKHLCEGFIDSSADRHSISDTFIDLPLLINYLYLSPLLIDYLNPSTPPSAMLVNVDNLKENGTMAIIS